MKIDPIHQFNIEPIITLGHIGKHTIAITNSTIYMFVAKGVPGYIVPLVMFIEILSFFLRPVSHSVRLFANMLAGHIALKVFAGFVGMLGVALGALGWIGGIAPLALTVALTALELLVAFLQAYVFAILTCIYLNDAIHPGH